MKKPFNKALLPFLIITLGLVALTIVVAVYQTQKTSNTINANISTNTSSNIGENDNTASSTEITISGTTDVNSPLKTISLSPAREFWVSRTPIDGEGTLNLLNLTTQSFTTTRKYPFQGQNTDNSVMQPRGNRFVYYKVPRSENDASSGLYLSDPYDKTEMQIADGLQCLDGPCSYDTSIGGGILSPSGKYFSYKDGNKMYVRNLVTGDTVETPFGSTPWQYSTANFSPSENFLIISSDNSILYSALDGKNYRTIARNGGVRAFFSPNDQFIVLLSRSTSNDSELILVDSLTGDILHKYIFQEPQPTDLGELVWMTNSTFVLWQGNGVSWHQSLFTIANNTMTAVDLPSWEGGQNQVFSVYRIDDNSILITQYEGNTYEVKKQDLGGKQSLVYQASSEDTQFFEVLGPNQ